MRVSKLFYFIFLLGFIHSSSPLLALQNNDGYETYDCRTSDNNCCTLNANLQTQCCDLLWDPLRLYVDHVEGRWLDNGMGYTSLGIFYSPIKMGDLIPFLDLRGHIFNDGRAAGNVGGGLRYVVSDQDAVYGVNAYYDFRQSSWRHHWYDQVGVGFERLSPCFDVRINGYIPINSTAHSSKHFFDVGNGFFATCREKRSSMWGLDAEIGKWLFQDCYCFDLYGALGAYYNGDKKNNDHHALGGQARLAAYFYKYFSAEVQAGYDEHNHGMAQGRVTVEIPLSSFSFWKDACSSQTSLCDCLRDLFYQPVERREIIALGGKDCCWTWNWNSCDCESCQDCR